ncbi:hypothetical protein BN946_scf184939.g6 [Trametes cinnabarina]|uniref:Uncharacterized protein n=1 Tax=Pycnoporus cinnabarinus TaxID=5643 RepID=A0A060SBE8_PYCCI|nr:hypothetical protein BN946_scf184939.g6 [Trametes cinnabarina]
MSQYSLATCDPTKTAKEDRANVRGAPPVTGSVSTVLFETGTMDTFMSTGGAQAAWETRLESGRGFGGHRALPPLSWLSRSSSGSSESALITPLKDSFDPKTVFGGPVIDSPTVSRTNTFDPSVVFLSEAQADSSDSFHTSMHQFVPKRPKKRPSPLRSRVTKVDVEMPGPTPTPTPTRRSAFTRMFGRWVKSIR